MQKTLRQPGKSGKVSLTPLFCALVILVSGPTKGLGQTVYSGMCDASGAVALDPGHFIVANDETDTLFVYSTDAAPDADGRTLPVDILDLEDELKVSGKKNKEADIEGATRIGERIYWITSHGRNRKGKVDKNRYQFFATQIKPAPSGSPSPPDLRFTGSFTALGESMMDASNWPSPPSGKTREITALLAGSMQLDSKEGKMPGLAPKKAGLNIEGLSATADHTRVLIGLRNPLSGTSAIVVPLLNPSALVDGSAKAARFGQPSLLDMGARGIRAMEYVPALEAYLIIAGPVDDETTFKLFKWSGPKDRAEEETLEEIAHLDQQMKNVNPEALIVHADDNTIQVFNDEGKRKVNGSACGKLDPKDQRFSDFRLDLVPSVSPAGK